MVRIVARGEMSPGHPSIETDRNGQGEEKSQASECSKRQGKKVLWGREVGEWGSDNLGPDPSPRWLPCSCAASEGPPLSEAASSCVKGDSSNNPVEFCKGWLLDCVPDTGKL